MFFYDVFFPKSMTQKTLCSASWWSKKCEFDIDSSETTVTIWKGSSSSQQRGCARKPKTWSAVEFSAHFDPYEYYLLDKQPSFQSRQFKLHKDTVRVFEQENAFKMLTITYLYLKNNYLSKHWTWQRFLPICCFLTTFPPRQTRISKLNPVRILITHRTKHFLHS